MLRCSQSLKAPSTHNASVAHSPQYSQCFQLLTALSTHNTPSYSQKEKGEGGVDVKGQSVSEQEMEERRSEQEQEEWTLRPGGQQAGAGKGSETRGEDTGGFHDHGAGREDIRCHMIQEQGERTPGPM